MKKLFRGLLMLLMVLCTFTLVACGDDEPDKLTDQQVVDAAKTTLTINYTEVTTDFTLPTTAAGGVTVSWASNDAAIVISGQNAAVTRPAFEDGNKTVTLTATLAKGDASATKDFTVVVVCLEDVDTIEALTVAEAIASEQGATVTVRGIVSGFHYSLYQDAPSIQACYITDNTGTVYVYGYLVAQSVEKGDDIVIEATVGEYKGYTQLTSPNLVQTVSKGNAIPTEGARTDKTIADISADLAGNYTAAAYLFEGVQIKKIDGGSYINYVVEDKNGNSLNIYSGANSVEFGWLEEYLGKEVKVLFAVNSQNSKGTKWRGHVLDVVEVIGDWAGGSQGGGNTSNATTATVSEVLAAAASLADGAKLEGKYKTTGTVTAITAAYDASYGNISFKLSDGTNEILCYRTYGDLAASVAQGDTVTVVGEVQNYGGTIEFVYADVTARTAGQGGGNQGGNEGGNTGTGETGSETAPLTVAQAIAAGQGTTVYVKGVVSGFHYSEYNGSASIQACYITDATGTVYVYGYLVAQSVQKGDEVVLSATIGEYKGYTQLTTPTLVSTVSTGNAIPTEGARTDKTVAQIAADLSTNYTAAAYLFEGVQIKKIDGGSYINYVVEDKDGNAINIYSGANSVEFDWLTEYLGKEVKVLFAINSQNSKGTKWRGHVLDVVEVIGDWAGGSQGGTEGGNQGGTEGGNQGGTEGGNQGGTEGGNQGGTEGGTTTEGYVTAPQVGTAYKLGMIVSGDKAVYLTGEMSGYYGASTETYANGKDVYLETVEGGYNMYYMNGTTKTYIVITVSGTHYNITFQASAGYVWTWDATYNTVVCDANGTKVFLGTHGTYSTFGGSDYSKYVASSYLARFYTAEASTGGSTGGNEGGSTGGNTGSGSTDTSNAAATISFADTANRTSADGNAQVWAQNGITVTNSKGSSTSDVNPQYYNPVRFYKSSDLKIEYTSNITKIVLNCSTADRQLLDTDAITGATITTDGTTVTITLDTPATSFTISTLPRQIRVSAISVFTE